MKNFYSSLLALFFANVLFLNSASAQVQLVKDINPVATLNSSNPSKFVTIGSETYFSAATQDYGTELWKTDGTSAGTVMVADLGSGSGSSFPNNLTNVNGTLFFTTSAGGTGTELWKSDGTEEGTVIVKDIYPGNSSSLPSYLTAMGSTLFFQANDGTNGYELWKSDGTEAGTVLVKDINPGSSSSTPAYMTIMGSYVYFQAYDGTNGIELWKSDGSSGNTSLVKDIYAGASSSSPSNFVTIGSNIFFSANDGVNGVELWKSNGTSIGTSMIKDIYAGATNSTPSYLTVIGTTLFFNATDTSGSELWKCDSPYNSAATVKVMDIYSGATSSTPQNLTNVNGILFFSANDGVNGTELWLSDGFSTGMVNDIYSGASSSSPGYFCVYNNALYFKATDVTNGTELWKSDGTASGTVMVKDIESGVGSSLPSNLYSTGTFLIFQAYSSSYSYEPWISDGTSGGTTLLLNINPEIGASYPFYITNVNDTVYFMANDGVNGIELWKSDGTTAGTVMVKDIWSGANSGALNSSDGIVNINGTLFFMGNDGTNGYELWKSDRTAAGTVMVKDINPVAGSSSPGRLMNVNGTLFFWANDGTNGNELWKSDPPYNSGSTSLVKDIYPGVSSSTPNGYAGTTVSYKGLLYFQANDGTNGNELWQSDGTSGGTTLVKDIYSGASGGYPNGLYVCNGNLFFYATDANGIELWMSDGTTTALLKDINPGSGNSSPMQFYDMSGTLLFAANDGAGNELWKSDGTPAGTVLVKNVYPGYAGTSLSTFTKYHNVIYFRAKNAANGLELWTTDGTSSGTVLFKDLDPGPNHSVPASFVYLQDTMFFTARTVAKGTELYVSTGTPQTTAIAADIYPGVGASSPVYLTATSKALFFSANDGTNGRELWKLTMPAAVTSTVSATNNICYGGTNGSINLTVSGGTSPYTYAWSNTAITEDISGLIAGTYSVLITDSWGWTKTNTVTLTQPATTTVAVTSQTNVTCNGGNNGVINISVTGGGTAPYTYLWSPGNATTQNISALTANTYSVLVTDAFGCTNTFSTSVSQPPAVAATTTVTNTSCFAGSNGTATVNVTVGVSPFTYLWNFFSQTTSTATGLSAGTFSVTVTDATGCIGNFSATVSQPTAFSTTVTVTDENCSGGSNGGADLTVSGATAPYIYLWSNAATTQDITNVSATNYSVTITDSKGCTKTDVAVINQPATFSSSMSKTDVTCNGLCNGTATANISGGTSPYQYLWSASNQTTTTATGLCFGTYNVTVTDNHGCVITPNVSITQPTSLTTTVSATNASCGNNDGTATTTPSGGTSPYTYNWLPSGGTNSSATGLASGTYTVTVTDSKGCQTSGVKSISQLTAFTGFISISPTNVSCNGGNNGLLTSTITGGTSPYTYSWSGGQSTSVATGLSAGSYTLILTDANGCQGSKTAAVTEPTALTSTIVPTDVKCNGASNGSADLSVSGGTTPYTYLWSNSSTTQNISNLPANNYSVLITDANGCTKTQSAIVNEPALLTSTISVTNVTCNGLCNGTATANISGGTSPYQYLWSVSNQTTQIVTGLCPGTYNLSVTDNKGCVITPNANIGEPAVLTVSVTAVAATCSNNGTATATPGGGTSPFTYNWTGGLTTQTVSNLAAGNYSVTITDFHNCTATGTGSVGSNPLVSSATATDVNCNGYSNGSVNLTVSGGTASYTFLWSNNATIQSISNVSANTYSVLITDATGCTQTQSATVNEPALLSATISKTDVTCNGLCDGTATANVSGGTSPYLYSWQTSPVQTTQTATGLCPNTYNLTLTDSKGCSSTPNVSITEPAALSVSVSKSDATCGNADGTASASAAGGSGSYTYNWNSSPAQTTQTAFNLANGNYSVTVTDANGCTTSGSIAVNTISIPQQICMVTVDSTSTKNVIVWEKPVATNIDSFRIYRLISSTYTHVGSVAYSSLSMFTDNTNGVNPNITAYKYEVSALDTCNNESVLSAFHQTMNLQVSVAAPPNSFNLSWNDYLGFSISQYRILVDSLNDGNWKVRDSVPFGNPTNWTDIYHYPDTVNYMIEIVHPAGCTATLKNPIPMATNLNSSRSNVYRIQDTTMVSVNNIAEDLLINIYPNPSNGIFTVAVAGGSSSQYKIEIYNVLGEKVYKAQYSILNTQYSIDLRKQSKGVYFMQISTSDKVTTKKIIIE